MTVADIRTPANKDIVVTAGDSVRLQLFIKQGGLPVDMSQYDGTLACIVDPSTDEVLDSFAVDLTDAAVGVILLTLTVTQTSGLCPCAAIWYCQAVQTSDADNNSHTLISGDFEVLKRRGFGG